MDEYFDSEGLYSLLLLACVMIVVGRFFLVFVETFWSLHLGGVWYLLVFCLIVLGSLVLVASIAEGIMEVYDDKVSTYNNVLKGLIRFFNESGWENISETLLGFYIGDKLRCDPSRLTGDERRVLLYRIERQIKELQASHLHLRSVQLEIQAFIAVHDFFSTKR